MGKVEEVYFLAPSFSHQVPRAKARRLSRIVTGVLVSRSRTRKRIRKIGNGMKAQARRLRLRALRFCHNDRVAVGLGHEADVRHVRRFAGTAAITELALFDELLSIE
jgi:hypothetical protein